MHFQKTVKLTPVSPSNHWHDEEVFSLLDGNGTPLPLSVALQFGSRVLCQDKLVRSSAAVLDYPDGNL